MLISEFKREYKKRNWQFWNTRKSNKKEERNKFIKNAAIGTAATGGLLYLGLKTKKAIPKIKNLKTHTKEYTLANKMLRETGGTEHMRKDYLDSIRSTVMKNKDNIEDLDYMTKVSVGKGTSKLETNMMIRKIKEEIGGDLSKLPGIGKLFKGKSLKEKDQLMEQILKRHPDAFAGGYNPSKNVPPPKP